MNGSAAILDDTRLRLSFAGVVVAMVVAMGVLLAPARQGLVIYAAGETAPTVVAAFVKSTGVPVTLVRLSTGSLLARIAGEGTRPAWTLAWFDGDMAAEGLDGAGLLAHGTTPLAEWTPLGRLLVPANGAWTPVAFSVANMSVTLRGAAGSMPAAAVLGMADPALSGPAYLQVISLLIESGGWLHGRPALRRFGAHGLSISPTSPNVVTQLRNGRIGRALLQSNTAYLLASRDAHVRVSLPRIAYVLPSVVVEAAGTAGQRRIDAARFLRFVAANATQSDRLASGRVDAYAWPTVDTNFAVPKILPPLATLHAVHLDPIIWGARQAEITDWFEAEVAGR